MICNLPVPVVYMGIFIKMYTLNSQFFRKSAHIAHGIFLDNLFAVGLYDL